MRGLGGMPSSDFHVATGRRANRLSVAWVVALLVGVQVLAASGCVTPRAEVRATQVEKLESLRRALNEEDYSSTIGVVKALPEEGQAAIPILVETAINGKGYAPCCASWCLARMGVPGAAALTEVLVRCGPMPRRWARV